jgi:hypothetical protein
VPAGQKEQALTVRDGEGVRQTAGPPPAGWLQVHAPSPSLPHSGSPVQARQVYVAAPHRALAQSSRSPQCLPLAQRGQLPPQSTSPSVPFWLPSLHVGGDSGANGAAGMGGTALVLFFFLFLFLFLASAWLRPGRGASVPSASAEITARARRREDPAMSVRVTASNRSASKCWLLDETHCLESIAGRDRRRPAGDVATWGWP